ncbi:hypothetical protein H6G52_16630 [Limnothrix sp. FACHB-881]|uniref:hypothetical protein n=1 Tax=Limnothrix sp. FACHB-881 TaxID=2692819 RepID=UPI00168594D7|nr:hypothetical protein [Limnothrix sp. FACHB-881]MBD2636997.1 hypothetical protein [Limnothrix sp. FACHB-881]
MEDLVLTELKEARRKGWRRVKELVGEMAAEWLSLDEENPSPETEERLENLKQQAFELLDTLIPDCGWIRYGVYDPENDGDGFVMVRICHNDVDFSQTECITTPIVRPATESPAPESSAIDLLKALGE